MAIVPSTKYSTQIDTSDPTGYPQGKAKNVVTAGDGSGTPLEKDWVNDAWGFFQSLLSRAGITPSGSPDKVGTSDYLDALNTMLGGTTDLRWSPFQVPSATYYGEKSLSAQSTAITGICWSQDGSYLFATANAQAWRYDCTTPFDISTATYGSETTTAFATEDNLAEGIAVNDDGTKLYILGNQNNAAFQYSMSPAYDLSSASYDTVTVSVSTQTTSPRDWQFSQDGTVMYLLAQSNVWKYDLTAWSLGTASYDTGNTVDVTSEAIMSGIAVSDDGKSLLLAGDDSPETVYQYRMSTAEDLTTATHHGETFDYSGWETQPFSIAASTNGGRLYLIGRDADAVFEFDMGRIGF